MVFAYLEEKFGRQKTNITRFFSAAIVILLTQYKTKNHLVIIDLEYPGREKEIINFIAEFSKKVKLEVNQENFTFSKIGKNNQAHILVWENFRKIKKFKNRQKIPKVRLEELIRILL